MTDQANIPPESAEFLKGGVMTRDDEDITRRQKWLHAATERGQQLRAAIAVATEALALREREYAARLVLSEKAMRVAIAAADAAQAVHTAEQHARDDACVPLRNRIADLTKELNKPRLDPETERRQWQREPGAAPLQGGEKVGAERSDRTFYPDEVFPGGRNRPA